MSLNGHYDLATATYLLALKSGHKPDRPDIPPHWQNVVQQVEWDFTRSEGDAVFMEKSIEQRCQSMPELGELLTIEPPKKKARGKKKAPELPLQGGGGQTEQQSFNCTDLGNAERFAARYRDTVRWCEVWKCWMIFNGRRWEADHNGTIGQYAKSVVRNIYKEAAASDDPDVRARLAKHAIASESARKIRALIDLAKSELPVSHDQFNTHLHLLNCQNGTLDLKTGELRPHNPADMLTRCLEVSYNPSAQAPTWLRFVNRIFGQDQALIRYVQASLGMTLSGDTREQCWYLLHGEGNNGKSTFTEIPRAILEDYGLAADIKSFMMNRDEKNYDRADFYGKRIVTASEIQPGQRLNESFMKKLTSGRTEKLRAERKFENAFEFYPECTVWLSVNHKPVVKDNSKGMWRRVRYIPFNVIIPASEVDTELPAKLLREAEGILAWMVEGCLVWQQSGKLIVPDVVAAATKHYQKEQDAVARFFDEECIFSPAGRTFTGALNARYELWCTQKQEKVDTTALKEALNKQGLHSKRSTGGKWCYEGIELRPMDTQSDGTKSTGDGENIKSDGNITQFELESDGSDGSDMKVPKVSHESDDRKKKGKTMSLPSLPSLFELESDKNSDGSTITEEKSLQKSDGNIAQFESKNDKTAVIQAFNEGIELADLLQEVQEIYKKRAEKGIFRQMWHAPGEPIRQLTESDYRARVECSIQSGNNERIQSARIAMLRTLGRYEEE